MTDDERRELFERHPVPWGFTPFKPGHPIVKTLADANGKHLPPEVNQVMLDMANAIGPRDPAKLEMLLEAIGNGADVRQIRERYDAFIQSGGER